MSSLSVAFYDTVKKLKDLNIQVATKSKYPSYPCSCIRKAMDAVEEARKAVVER